MKRKDLLKRIKVEANWQGISWALHAEGGNHSIYKIGGKKVPIGRHTEIDDLLAEKIFKECEEALGQRWWR